MKKNNIFKHELNESSQAKATLNCLKNRNNPEKLNEALPLVAGAIRLVMPLLRPLIIKLVKSMVMKAGAKLTGRQVAKAVIKNVSNGKTLMKIGKKVGQTWNEIPVELKQEIAKTAVDTFKQMRQPKQEVASQEQEETSDFDARFEFRKDLRELASPIAKKAYMIIRKQYGDGMWRRLYMDDCDERGLIDMLNMYAQKGLNPQQIVNKMLGVREEQEEFTSEQERHDIALATTYCLGESFIDNDGDLDDIYYAVLKVFDSTHDAPETTDYEDVLQWCRKYHKQIEKLITTEEQEEQIFKVRTKQGFVEVPLSSEVVDAFHDNLDPRYEDMDTQSALKGINGGARLAAIIAGMMEQGYKPTPAEQHILDLHYNAKKAVKQSQADSSDRNINAYSD